MQKQVKDVALLISLALSLPAGVFGAFSPSKVLELSRQGRLPPFLGGYGIPDWRYAELHVRIVGIFFCCFSLVCTVALIADAVSALVRWIR